MPDGHPIGWALAAIAFILLASVVLSLLFPRKEDLSALQSQQGEA